MERARVRIDLGLCSREDMLEIVAEAQARMNDQGANHAH